MTTARGPQRVDGWTAAARQRLGLGRLLPLGGPADGAWIAETAAAAVLREATARPGTVLGKLRIGPTEEAVEAAVAGGREASRGPAEPVPPPAPPNALPPVSLRIEADFSTTPDRPLPDAAAALRAALLAAATARLGLEIVEVDLTVTALLEVGAADQVTAAETASAARGAEPEGAVATAAARVPGVVSLTGVMGGPVHTGPDHVRVEVAAAADHRALDVARSVRAAVTAAMEDRLPVSVLVTDVVSR